MSTLSNTTALWLDAASALVPFIACLICGAVAWKNAHRNTNDDDYFPPHRFPEIERDPEEIARYLDRQGWAA